MRSKSKSAFRALAAFALALALALLPACSFDPASLQTTGLPSGIEYTDLGEPDFAEYAGQTGSFEEYSPLDLLGRCGEATACIGTDLMPTKQREQINSIKPSGWHRTEYDFIDEGLLYNRCHLIAYSLTAEDLNERNLVTGTRQMNLAMTQFENMVRDYVEDTGNHVLYRVTPEFEGAELVCRGVQMEALSVEDGGESISFNVFIPNEQDGVGIDYLTGYSWIAGDNGDASSAATEGSAGASQEAQGQTSEADDEFSYILNTRSMRFHLPSCDSVPTISAKNKAGSNETREELIAQGYKPCGSCQP